MGALVITFKDIKGEGYELKKGGMYQVLHDNYGAFINDEHGEDVYLADLNGWAYTLIQGDERDVDRDKLFSQLVQMNIPYGQADDFLSCYSLDFVNQFIRCVKQLSLHRETGGSL